MTRLKFSSTISSLYQTATEMIDTIVFPENQYNSLDTIDQEMFKDTVKNILRSGVATVQFTKTDGSIRNMQCTIKKELLPAIEVVESAEPKKVRAVNPDVCPVYDVEIASWRSFKYDSIKVITFENNIN